MNLLMFTIIYLVCWIYYFFDHNSKMIIKRKLEAMYFATLSSFYVSILFMFAWFVVVSFLKFMFG